MTNLAIQIIDKQETLLLKQMLIMTFVLNYVLKHRKNLMNFRKATKLWCSKMPVPMGVKISLMPTM